MMLLQARKVQIYKKLKSYLIQLKHYKKQSKMNMNNINNNATNNMRNRVNDDIDTSSNDDKTKDELELDEMIKTVEDKLLSDEYSSLWNPQKDLKAFIGIAGPYNLQDMKHYLDGRGLYSDVIYKIMNNDLRKASPFYCLYDLFESKEANRKLKPLNKIDLTSPNKPYISMTEIDFDPKSMRINEDIDYDATDELDEGGDSKYKQSKKKINNGYKLLRPKLNIDSIINIEKVELKLPSMYLFHGSNDLSCPVSNTKTFSLALANYGVKTFIKIYPNKSHTAPIIEDPISGKDPLCIDMLQIIYPNQSLTHIVHEIENTMTGGLRLPQFIIDLASFVCPF